MTGSLHLGPVLRVARDNHGKGRPETCGQCDLRTSPPLRDPHRCVLDRRGRGQKNNGIMGSRSSDKAGSAQQRAGRGLRLIPPREGIKPPEGHYKALLVKEKHPAQHGWGGRVYGGVCAQRTHSAHFTGRN